MGPGGRRGGGGRGTTVVMRDARCGGGRQLIRRGGMHVGRQRRRLASLGPERRVEGLIFTSKIFLPSAHWFPIIEMPSP